MAEPLWGTFRRPFDEQIAAFRLRLGNLVPTSAWDDLWQQQHDRAFMVAGAMKADLLADLAAAVDKAVAQGTSLEEFRRDFRAIVERHGWHGWTGEGSKKGEAWRTRVIYRTNMSTSYMAGRHAQLMAANYRYWVYRHSGAEHPRLDHLSWDGIALPPDHPFWTQHYPPNGWGCGCKVYGADSEDGIRRKGGTPGKDLPEGWDRVDPKTGAPVGIGKGWGYAPGATVDPAIRAAVEKAVNWKYSLATAYMRDLPASHRDAFSTGYRDLPSVGRELVRFADRIRVGTNIETDTHRTLGLATAEELTAIRAITGQETDGALWDYVVDADAIRHILARHGTDTIEISRGQRAVRASDFSRLPQLINRPDHVGPGDTADTTVVRYEKRIGNERLVALFRLRKGRRRLALLTMWVEVMTGASPTITP